MCESLPTSPNEPQFIYPFNFLKNDSFPKFHAAPTDQKLPHLLAAAILKNHLYVQKQRRYIFRHNHILNEKYDSVA
jgi:hypothetical protein